MASWAETDYPFGSPVSPATGPTLATDLNINKNNPAVEFTGTEANAIYDEIREVGGDFYFATNATYSTQWLPVNSALPAFALRLKSAGNMERVWCAAGTSPITWTVLTTTDASGAISTTPATFTTNAEIAQSWAPTWNASGVIMSAVKLNVTDTASSASSLLLDLQVGGTSQFNVTKAGALTLTGGITGTTAAFSGALSSSGVAAYVAATGLGALSNPGVSGGDGVFQRTASTGVVWIGGATKAALFDYGVTAVNQLSVNQSFNVNTGLLSVSALAALSSPGSTVSGDLVVQRSASTALAWFGGATNSGTMDWNLSNATAFSFFHSGGTYAPLFGGAYTNASDRRWKKNVVQISHGLDSLLKLNPVEYDWATTDAHGAGFIAQEVQAVIPNAVKEIGVGEGAEPAPADGPYLGITDSELTPVIVRAIQELSAKFDAYISTHP